MAWQVQEAKQRFSELLRAVEADGPQFVTRHGEPVAVVVDVAWFTQHTAIAPSFAEHLLGIPPVDGDDGDVMDEVVAARSASLPRVPDWTDGRA